MSAISTLPLGIARATFGAGLDCAVDSPLESPLDSTVEVVSAEAAAACAAKVAPPATEEEEERRTNKREDGTECRATRGRPLVKVRLGRHVRVYPPAIVQHAGQ
eukprot:scaffold78142_cov57-Phaeocystis_antarctica.AAC.1